MGFKQEQKWLLEEKYGGIKTPAFYEDVKRLEAGEPLGYIIGHVPFLHNSIDVSKRPLLPRPETEYWVGKAIARIQKERSPKETFSCLDLFSGSGCIGVALLSCFPNASVDFAEIEDELLEQIEINIKRNNLEKSRTNVFQSDVFSNVPSAYDYIFTNPPYLSSSRTKRIGKEVLSNEPHKALFAKDDGFEYIKILLRDGRHYVKRGGTLFIECDYRQKDRIISEFGESDWEFSYWPDQYGAFRVIVARDPGKDYISMLSL